MLVDSVWPAAAYTPLHLAGTHIWHTHPTFQTQHFGMRILICGRALTTMLNHADACAPLSFLSPHTRNPLAGYEAYTLHFHHQLLHPAHASPALVPLGAL